jgi:hypothetical protein
MTYGLKGRGDKDCVTMGGGVLGMTNILIKYMTLGAGVQEFYTVMSFTDDPFYGLQFFAFRWPYPQAGNGSSPQLALVP